MSSKQYTLQSREHQKGFTLFIAIVITGTLLLVSMGIINLAVKSAVIYSAARESQHAFYAADTGVECALYWDVKNPSGFSAFDDATETTIYCNRNANNPTNQFDVGGDDSSTFTMTFLPDPYCAKVTVTKLAGNVTRIESLGYNTCDPANSRRVERAVRATY